MRIPKLDDDVVNPPRKLGKQVSHELVELLVQMHLPQPNQRVARQSLEHDLVRIARCQLGAFRAGSAAGREHRDQADCRDGYCPADRAIALARA